MPNFFYVIMIMPRLKYAVVYINVIAQYNVKGAQLLRKKKNDGKIADNTYAALHFLL